MMEWTTCLVLMTFIMAVAIVLSVWIESDKEKRQEKIEARYNRICQELAEIRIAIKPATPTAGEKD